jgi:Arc/MetJ-type ribon-helix-helix transcriptional regulator
MPSGGSAPAKWVLAKHPVTIHIPSNRMEDVLMAAEIHRIRERACETEKITINLGYVDLGHIDLLVQEGFYSNRTDFIRTAIRNQLSSHGEEVRKSIVRHTLELGLRHYTRADLEAIKAAGEKLHIKVLGLASIAPDVTPALALATIESITVLGALHASKDIKSALADRIG